MLYQLKSADVLFSGIDLVPINYMNFPWKWGDLTNEVSLRFLCRLAALNFTPVFEFGTFRGRTTYNLALNSPSVVTIDIGSNKNLDEVPEGKSYPSYISGELLKGSKVESKVEQIVGDSTKVDLSSRYKTFGLVLVDGGHSYEVCRSDTVNALRLVRNGGIIVWDDYSSYWPEVQKVINEFALKYDMLHLLQEGFVLLKNGYKE